MILDVLEIAERYEALHAGFKEAFAFLRRPDLKDLPAGRHAIDGDRLYALVVAEPGRRKEDAPLETHRNYIDIQFMVEGIDEIGWSPAARCTKPSGAYDPDRDLQFYADEPEAWLATAPGAFAIFFPEDAHMPMIAAGQLHKVVIKVAVAAS